MKTSNGRVGGPTGRLTTAAATARTTKTAVRSERMATGSADTGANKRVGETSGKRGKVHSGRGLGLRNKFMLVLSGVTAVVLVLLGLAVMYVTSRYLTGLKQQDGIEIARLAAQIGNAVEAQFKLRLALIDKETAGDPVERQQRIKEAPKEIENQLRTLLGNAQQWHPGQAQYSDILAVRYVNGQLAGFGIGEEEKAGAQLGGELREVFIPKYNRTFALPAHIKVYAATRRTDAGEVPILRFKVALDDSRPDSATVRVDVEAKSLAQARSNLYVVIGIAVLTGIGLVIAVANWLAGNITKPVDLLLRDMQTVSRGNLDHQTKPHSSDEIGLLADEFNRMTHNLKHAQRAVVEQEKAAYELSLAREVQHQLLPAETPRIAGYDSAAFYHGAKAVSGDYFDIIPLSNGLWGFIVADVSGKGIPGSMVMAVTRTIVRLVAGKHQNRAADTLRETNRLIAKQIKRGMFVTAFYAILDESTGTFTYASAGHNPMVVYRAATRSYELATTKGIAIGFNEGPIFDKTLGEERVQLQKGDAVVIYTDGFPEAMNAADQEFGEERFYKAVARSGHLDSRALLTALVTEVTAHRGEAEQSDDLTGITVRLTA